MPSDRSEVSLAVTVPCRLQVCTVFGGSAGELPGHCSTFVLEEYACCVSCREIWSSFPQNIST
jgi:hypothetical protein